jgi:DNA-binding HxlR family transcriptional regulator
MSRAFDINTSSGVESSTWSFQTLVTARTYQAVSSVSELTDDAGRMVPRETDAVSQQRPDDDPPVVEGGVHARERSTIEKTLSLVGDRWTILVLRASFRGIRRFDDFCDDLGIARPILTARLRKLVAAGLMTKELYQQRPPRYEYRLTPAGIALSPAIVALVRWGDEHLGADTPATKLVHAPCGTELEQGFWCRRCATTFGPGAIRGVAPGDDVPDQ